MSFSSGDIVLADVIDSDSWRLWPHGDKRLQVDKQFYRDLPEVTAEALKELKAKFEWTSEQLKVRLTSYSNMLKYCRNGYFRQPFEYRTLWYRRKVE